MTVAKSSPRWTLFTYAVLCTPLVLLLVMTIRGAYVEYRNIRSGALQSESDRLRAQAMRRVAHLRAGLQARAADPADWDVLAKDPWISAFWKAAADLRPHELYAAVVDRTGNVVLHSNPDLVGQHLGHRWYDYTVPNLGGDVVVLRDSALAPGASAYDIHVPLVLDGQEIGDYHEGFDAKWFESEVAHRQQAMITRWGWWTAFVAGVSLAATLALAIVARRHLELLHSVRQGGRTRAAELSQIAAGLAHEIRNPLHALRINLHSLKRTFAGQSRLTPDDIAASIQDSNNAIDGLDRLMRDMLHYTTADGGQRTQVNLNGELTATLNLLSDEMRKRQIALTVRQPEQPLMVAMDPARLRQALLNLLTFAQNNAGVKGQIEVTLAEHRKHGELAVVEGGPTMCDGDRLELFQPFQAKRETGSGLGLALVRTFVEEVGGQVVCEPLKPTGNRFRVRLPLI